MTVHRISPCGVRIDYDDRGAGDVVLLGLPGWCVDRTIFTPIADVLEGLVRVVALDYRNHGSSEAARDDFGTDALVEDALAVVRATGAQRVIPVAQAHAGWIAIELRRRLGERVAGLVFTSWTLGELPGPLRTALRELQHPKTWAAARDQLLSHWLGGGPPHVSSTIRAIVSEHDFDMFSRAGREIERAYARHGSGLAALSALAPHAPSLHLYAQPRDPEVLALQQRFARENPWFSVERLDGVTHFPTLETPDACAEAIGAFARRVLVNARETAAQGYTRIE